MRTRLFLYSTALLMTLVSFYFNYLHLGTKDARGVFGWLVDIFLFFVAAALTFVTACECRTRRRVFHALYNAAENDYDLSHVDPNEVAADLILYDSSFESSCSTELLCHIRAWQALFPEGLSQEEARLVRR